MANTDDDSIFSLPGDLTGGHLSPPNASDDNTHGLRMHFSVNGKTGENIDANWKHEISNIQNCPIPSCPITRRKIQGTDHGKNLRDGPVYGNYTIYVSYEARRVPSYSKFLILQMEKH